MNAIKNALVTTTLVAVGYGVWVILSTPNGPAELTDESGVENWAAETWASSPSTVELQPPPLAWSDGGTADGEAGMTAPPPSAIAGTPWPSSTHSDPSLPQAPQLNDAQFQPDPGFPPQPAQEGQDPQAARPPAETGAPPSASPASLAARETVTSQPMADPVSDFHPPATEASATAVAPDPTYDAPTDTDRRVTSPYLSSSPAAELDAAGIPPVTTAAPRDTGSELAAYGAETRDAAHTPATQAPAPAPSEEAVASLSSDPTVTQDAAHPHVGGTRDDSSSAFQTAWQTAQRQIQQGQLANALFTLSIWYQDLRLNTEERHQCVELLDELAGEVVYSRHHHMHPPYVVRTGDSLEGIADQFDVPPLFLARVNGLSPPYGLQSGETLKVVQGPFRAEIDTQRGEMTVFAGSYYAGRFPVEIGDESTIMRGTFEVATQTSDPSYVHPQTGENIAGGDPRNPYGRVWLGLRNETTPIDVRLGLHGGPEQTTPEAGPSSIRLSSRDVDDVQAILSLGSAVIIR